MNNQTIVSSESQLLLVTDSNGFNYSKISLIKPINYGKKLGK